MRSTGECRSFRCLSHRFVDALALLVFWPMRGSEGPNLVSDRSLPRLFRGWVAVRSNAPLVPTSDGPPIELPTELPTEPAEVLPELPPAPAPPPPPPPPCASANVEPRVTAAANVRTLSFMR